MATRRRLAGLLPRTLALAAGGLLSVALLPVQPVAAASAYATTTDIGTAAQIDASHDGVLAHDTLAPPLALAWNINLGGSASYPLVDNGRVFVTAINSNGSVPQLWALDQQTGATLWGPIVLSGPGWANATLESNRIFVEDVRGFLQAFDENGNRIWGTQLTGSYFSAPPTAANGVVYTSSADSGLTTGRLFAIRETDGTTLWTAPIVDGEYSSPVVSPSGVYVSYACAQTYDFSPTTGALIWQHAATSCSSYGGTTPVLANGKLYIRDATAGNLILDASSGASLGTFIGTVTPAISGTRGFFKDQSAVYGYDLASNTRLWAFYGDGTLTSAPITVGSYVYVASRNGTVYALDSQTGAQVWTASTSFVCCMNGPNEQDNFQPLTGLGAGYGMLFVPSGSNLMAFGGQETLYPGDAAWAYTPVGQAAQAAPFTLISNSISGLSISSISTTGDYAETNSCPPTLPFGSKCIISVTFTPSAVGSRAGTLTVNDSAAGSPHVIPLSGSGSPSGSQPQRLVLSPGDASISAGGAQTYRAEAFDGNNVDLGDVTSSTSFALDGISCGGPSCTTTRSGGHTVTGTYGSVTGSATLSVSPGSLDHLSLSPATATLIAGTSQSYTVEGFDVYGNDLGNQTTASTLTITPDGTCSGAGCTATKAGVHTVTASSIGKSATATLSINPGAAASLSILPVSVTAFAGGQTAFHAIASDQYGNPVLGPSSLGEVTTLATFTIGANGTCTSAICGSTVAGNYTVVTAYQGLTAAATLTVTHATADHLQLTPANATIVAGGSQAYTVQSVDSYGNTVADVTSSTTFSIAPGGSCSANVCSATQAGTSYTVNAYSGMTATANLTVIAGSLDHLAISPASGTITAGQYQPFTVFAVDQYGNPTADAAATTFAITPDGTCSLGSGSASCTATHSGPHSLTASLAGKSVTATLTVNPGPVTRLRVGPAITTIPVGGSQAFSARTVDAYENTVADVTSATTFSLSPNGTCSGNVCTAPTQATTNGDVTAAYNGMTDGMNLVFSPGPLDHIAISPASSSMTAGQSQTYSDIAYDQYNNYVGNGNVTGTSTYAITPDGSCNAATCTATRAGSHTVSATYQGKTATTALTVNAGAVATLTLTPATATIAAGSSQAYAVEGFDAYGNDLGSLTLGSSLGITPDGNCTSTTCTAITSGAHTITATTQGKTATATLTVNAGPVTAFTISPAIVTLTVGSRFPLTAIATDSYNNVADASGATWSASPLTPGTFAPTTGSATIFTASASFAGTGTVTAHLGTFAAQVSVRVLPAAPTALTATSPASHKAALGWSASAADLTYAVYRQTGTGAWTLVKSGITSTSFTDSGLASGTTYNYRVTGWFGGLEGPASNTATLISR